MDRSTPLHPVPAGWLRDGSLARCEAPYRQWLDSRGYADRTTRVYTLCLARVDRWATAQPLTPEELSATAIDHFVDGHLPRCDCPPPVRRHRAQVRAALAQLLPALGAVGMAFADIEPDAVTRELARFDAHLRNRRGLAENTRKQRRAILAALLRRPPTSSGLSAWRDPGQLRRFIAERLERWSPSSAGVLATTLRGYLPYRASLGDDVVALRPVIAPPARWRLAELPLTLSPDEVERVLGSFGPSLPSRRRSRALTHCVARLGLRSAEVIGLEREELNRSAGTLRLRRNKSRRVDVLPMPDSIGEALVDYLRCERPRCKTRRIFFRHVAPVERPLQPSVVIRAVVGAYVRCGLPYTRVRILRHSLAARVLGGGGTLKEVADVLRLRDLSTTQTYVKVDLPRLAAVAMPWPGSES